MITRLSYEDSGVEWIGDIPSEWNIKPMYTQYCQNRIRNDNSTDTVLSLSYGNLVKRDIEKNQGLLPDNFDSYQLLDVGYIILRMTDLQNDHKSLRVGICEFPGIITSAYIGLSPFKSVYSKYFFYYLYMCDLKKVFYGLGGGLRQSVSYNDFKRFSLPVPPLQEQQQISDYLDYKTSKIDTLLEKTQQKIELLKEQRTSLINTTVTKGLDPNVEMKDSRVEWIGEIPSEWILVSIKRLCSIKRGSSPRPIDNPDYFDVNGEFSWVRIADVSSSERYLENTKQQLSELGSSLSTKRYPGDLFLSIAGTVGKPIITKIKCCIHDGFVWFDGLSINQEFLYYVFSVGQCFKGLGKMGTQLNLNTDTVGLVKIPLMDIQEQQEIVDYLDKETSKIDKLVDIESKRIILLKEYRQTLISEVVTGKVDVRNEVLV